MSYPARFISFEGGEGSGKTTQIAHLAEVLNAAGVVTYVTREPGGEEQAELLRTLLVSGEKHRWDPVAETLLFLASRVQHVARVIRPKLASGVWVLSDRSLDSTRVYQGMAKGVGVERYDALHRLCLDGFMPDLTILLDIDPELGIRRSLTRTNHETRFEGMEMEFHHSVRQGFLDLACGEPERFAVVDAAQARENVSGAVMRAVGDRLGVAL